MLKLRLATVTILLAMMFGVLLFASTISAAPITCPGPQTAVHLGGGSWECQNNGGNLSGASNPKNPNR